MFLIFAGRNYYPGGGAGDFITVRPTLREAQLYVQHQHDSSDKYEWEWAHIAELKGDTLVIVAAWCPNTRVSKAHEEYKAEHEDFTTVLAEGVTEQLSWFDYTGYTFAADGDFWEINGVYHLPLSEEA